MEKFQEISIHNINKILGEENINSCLIESCGRLLSNLSRLNRIDNGDVLVTGSNRVLIDIDENIADVIIDIERLQDSLVNRKRVEFFINKKLNTVIEIIHKVLTERKK